MFRILVLLALALPLCAADLPKLRIAQNPEQPRIWRGDFSSNLVPKNPMRMTIVMPEGVKPTDKTRLPVIYILHGRGRHDRTMIENPITLKRLLESPCIIVMPQSREGWYINSPVLPNERYADYIDQVIALAEANLPVATTASQRAITGWSMGGYGAAYIATRRPNDFAALATMIGLLDFPREQIDVKGQNYTVPARYGEDPAFWKSVNPRYGIERIRHMPLYIAYADRAPERQMNEVFIQDAKAAGMDLQVLVLHGGHTFPMVEQSLPAVLDFLESKISQPSGNIR